ncbi:MAG: metallophosphoesterase [Thermodesulfobacteriota bacterium]
MIIITDAHIDHHTEAALEFFQMLAALEATDQDVVFLGDIFDLWIGMERYETETHRSFLSWCREQLKHRRIGFMEGNHEYFVARERRDFFTWCTADEAWRDEQETVYCHGDQLNRLDRQYLRFRKAAKNPVTRHILHRLPFGPQMGRVLKRLLKNTNHDFRKHVPYTLIDRFAEDRFNSGVRTIFVGHFHQAYAYRGLRGGRLQVIPGWHGTGLIARFEPHSEKIDIGHWTELAS